MLSTHCLSNTGSPKKENPHLAAILKYFLVYILQYIDTGTFTFKKNVNKNARISLLRSFEKLDENYLHLFPFDAKKEYACVMHYLMHL